MYGTPYMKIKLQEVMQKCAGNKIKKNNIRSVIPIGFSFDSVIIVEKKYYTYAISFNC